MKATQLIEKLQAMVAEHGDLEVIYYDECWYLPAGRLEIENNVEVQPSGPMSYSSEDGYTLSKAILIGKE